MMKIRKMRRILLGVNLFQIETYSLLWFAYSGDHSTLHFSMVTCRQNWCSSDWMSKMLATSSLFKTWHTCQCAWSYHIFAKRDSRKSFHLLLDFLALVWLAFCLVLRIYSDSRRMITLCHWWLLHSHWWVYFSILFLYLLFQKCSNESKVILISLKGKIWMSMKQLMTKSMIHMVLSMHFLDSFHQFLAQLCLRSLDHHLQVIYGRL